MSRKSLNNLEDLGEAGQLVSDFKFVKNEYFDLKRRQMELMEGNSEVVEDKEWRDENFEEERRIFEKRKKLNDEAQELYRTLKTKLS